MALDQRVRAALQELGAALNEAVSSSEKVQAILARLREDGYDPYLVLDATVALDQKGRRSSAALPSIRRGGSAANRRDGVAFQINVKDLNLLKSLGIDPTRPVRARRRTPAATVTLRSTVAKKS
jgi:hypothetical protein